MFRSLLQHMSHVTDASGIPVSRSDLVQYLTERISEQNRIDTMAQGYPQRDLQVMTATAQMTEQKETLADNLTLLASGDLGKRSTTRLRNLVLEKRVCSQGREGTSANRWSA